MENLTETTIKLIETITFPGALALAIFVIGKPLTAPVAKWIESKVMNKPSQINALQASIDTLSENHIHELHDSLERIERSLEKLNDNVIFIKTKLNGK